jgi:hypothetical protein
MIALRLIRLFLPGLSWRSEEHKREIEAAKKKATEEMLRDLKLAMETNYSVSPARLQRPRDHLWELQKASHINENPH